MILVLSCFVTHKRQVNKLNRLEVFKHTLKSYSRIKWERIFLFIKLDSEFKSQKEELEFFIAAIFCDIPIAIEWTRYERQSDWQVFVEMITRENKLIWFTQNDDHPFIDTDLKVLNEGINLLNQDPEPYRSLYFSHWPEILKLSGKLAYPELVGSYVKFKATLIDSIQIFSSDLFRYLFLDLDWRGKRYARIDTLLRQRSIWGQSEGNTDLELQNIYVPLRELCRKFFGYDHVGMENVSALQPAYEIQALPRGRDDLITLMRAKHHSPWTQNNNFSVPDEWIERSISLYSESQERRQTGF
jgi:hypothetical protein